MLYSGGLDSFCLKEIYKPEALLSVNVGTEDCLKEQELIKKTVSLEENLITIDASFLKQFELENKIIPFRNNFFILLASQFSNLIYIGATKGDTTKDKDYVFKSQMENVLNYFSLDQHKVNVKNYPYQILMPFKDMTKTEIVAKYLKSGGDVSKLLSYTRSCYQGGEKPCGKCRSCLRNAIAFVNNGIDIRHFFSNDPFGNISQETDEKMRSRKEESDDYIKALNNR